MELLNVIATIKDTKELSDEKLQISDAIVSTALKISKLLPSATDASITPVREGIHLTKISVPTFDGHILQWWSFWEQFELYIVHSRTELSDAVKLAYLRNALKDGPALNIIEGIDQTRQLTITARL